MARAPIHGLWLTKEWPFLRRWLIRMHPLLTIVQWAWTAGATQAQPSPTIVQWTWAVRMPPPLGHLLDRTPVRQQRTMPLSLVLVLGMKRTSGKSTMRRPVLMTSTAPPSAATRTKIGWWMPTHPALALRTVNIESPKKRLYNAVSVDIDAWAA